jgi:hypothetical protein
MSFWTKDRGGRQMREEQDTPNALPVFSVDTIDEARYVLVHFGKRSYTGSYYWTGFSGRWESLPKITREIQTYYNSVLKR